jgi:hypothetical protein
LISISPDDLEPDPIEIDPRPCELCGLTIDRHTMVDAGDGPEFFCRDLSPDDMTLDELERRAELRWQEEGAAILARWEAEDAKRPSAAPVPASKESHHTAQATIDAFLFVVRLGDADHLSRWLADHPLDAPHLLKIWERKYALA